MMKQLLLLLTGLIMLAQVQAQVIFKTIVPQEPVVAGESFNIQYVLDEKATGQFEPPSFAPFRLVDGPNKYAARSGKQQKLINIIYTLSCSRPGHYRLAGAVASLNGKPIHSEDVFIEVGLPQATAKTRADFSASYLHPGEDPYKKIHDNLFVKVKVDRNSCMVGQPVVATFKLYSCLQSKSDIIKNPAFYGFTAIDMVNLADNETVTELINGRKFDVHTIRKVQLYPLQAGSYVIDPMEIVNKVAFAKSAVNKNTEQEITEGIFEDNKPASENVKEYETRVSTPPLTIEVKSLPANKPSAFEGATGHFTITAALQKNALAKNEEGRLIITINGKGNFTQLAPPAIAWPSGIEGFDSSITDQFDKTTVPLSGNRSFTYAFIGTTPGTYTIPGISFSYYDTDSNRYQTKTLNDLQVTIENKEKPATALENPDIHAESRSWWLFAVILGVLIITILAIAIKSRKEKKAIPAAEQPVVKTIDDFLEPAVQQISAEGNGFYMALRQSVWNFFADHFALSGSEQNKRTLLTHLQQRQIPVAEQEAIIHLLNECEAGMFTQASLSSDKQQLLDTAKTLLGKL